VGEGFILIIVVPLVLAGVMALVFLLIKPTARPLVRRRQALSGLARSLGLRFLTSAEDRMIDFLPDCGVLEKGYGRSVRNLMVENRRPPRTVFFDYECSHLRDQISQRPSESDERGLYAVAMVAVEPETALTPATFHPTDWFGVPAGVRDAYRVEFPGAEEFQRSFAVVGRPWAAVIEMLEESVRAALLAWTGRGIKPTVQLLPGWVIAWRETSAAEADPESAANALLQYVTGIAGELDAADLIRRRREETRP
jgi:hypothetical protein